MTTRERTHPGRLIAEYLESIPVTELAALLDMPTAELLKVVDGKAPVAPEMAYWLSAALRTTPELCLHMQTNYDGTPSGASRQSPPK